MLRACGCCVAAGARAHSVWCGSTVLLPGLFVYLEDAEIKYKTHFIVLWCVLYRLAYLYRKWQKTFMISEILVVFSLFRLLRFNGRLSVAVENRSDFSLSVRVGLSVLVCTL